MLKKSNKIVALLLAVILLCGTSISVYAECSHNWVWFDQLTPLYEYVSATVCKKIVSDMERCTKCDSTRVITEIINGTHKGGTTKSATCNGKVQTLSKAPCSNCSGTYLVKQTCPGATHTGTCPYLPL